LKQHAYANSFTDEVVYDDDNAKIKSVCVPKVGTLFDFSHHIGTITKGDKINEDLSAKALSALIFLTTFMKHRGFKEENEIRLVASRNLPNSEAYKLPLKELDFRSRNNRPIPFIKLFEGLNIELPITRVLIGPGESKQMVAEAVKKFIGNRKIEVAVSDIPFA
jgi:hypothetical protein